MASDRVVGTEEVPRYNRVVFANLLKSDKGLGAEFGELWKDVRAELACTRERARDVAQSRFEFELERRGLLGPEVAGGYGIKAVRAMKGDDSGEVGKVVSLERDRESYVLLAQAVGRLGRKGTERQAVKWAMDNGLLPVSEIDPETVPGTGAVSMLWFFRVMPEKLVDAWKSLLSKADMEDRQRFDDTGENVIAMLAPLSDGLLDPRGGGDDERSGDG